MPLSLRGSLKGRSKAGGEPIKGRRRKTPEPKRHTAPKALSRFHPSPGAEIEVARLTRELSEAHQQQAATFGILKVISRSPGDLKLVFKAMLASAKRICQAQLGNMLLYDGVRFRDVTMEGAPPAYAKLWEGGLKPSPTSGLGKLVATKQVVHIPDITADLAYA
jgi:hypothetical protein